MAIFHLSAQIIGRSNGRSATAAAAYRSGVRIADERTGEIHDFTRKSGVRESFIVAPESAPSWMLDRDRLWNAVEASERRKDSQLAREVEVSLPHELTAENRRNLLLGFVQDEFVSRGMIADVAMHAPSRAGDRRNEHAHIMLTLREIDGDGFGKKAREWNDSELVEQWRRAWAQRVNQALSDNQIAERVDHRSYERQAVAAGHDTALSNLATIHLGPRASGMERRGKRTAPGDLNREIGVINLELERARRAAQPLNEWPDFPQAERAWFGAPDLLKYFREVPAQPPRKETPAATLSEPALPEQRPFRLMQNAVLLMNKSSVPAKKKCTTSTTKSGWTEAEKSKWRRLLLERHYQSRIEESLAVMLKFVDRNSVQNGLLLKLVGGGQIEDIGDRIQARGYDLQSECRATVALCKSKGWTSISSSGPSEYVAMMRGEAERAGLKFVTNSHSNFQLNGEDFMDGDGDEMKFRP
ncbi:MAG: MobA/MobL family protein [Luteimonas sp.]|nr:MobA/MobL family protein [Luteimonas sp.]